MVCLAASKRNLNRGSFGLSIDSTTDSTILYNAGSIMELKIVWISNHWSERKGDKPANVLCAGTDSTHNVSGL